jgi:hypothetical protein
MAEKTCDLKQENRQDDSKQGKKAADVNCPRNMRKAQGVRRQSESARQKNRTQVRRNMQRELTCRTQMLGRVPWYAFRDRSFAQCSPPASHSAATLTSILPRGTLTPAAALVRRSEIRAHQSLLWTIAQSSGIVSDLQAVQT